MNLSKLIVIIILLGISVYLSIKGFAYLKESGNTGGKGLGSLGEALIGLFYISISIGLFVISIKLYYTDQDLLRFLSKSTFILIISLVLLPFLGYGIFQIAYKTKNFRLNSCHIKNVARFKNNSRYPIKENQEIYNQAVKQIEYWNNNNLNIAQSFLGLKPIVDKFLIFNSTRDFVFTYLIYQTNTEVRMESLIGKKTNDKWNFYTKRKKPNLNLYVYLNHVVKDKTSNLSTEKLSKLRHFLVKLPCDPTSYDPTEIEKKIIGPYKNELDRQDKWNSFTNRSKELFEPISAKLVEHILSSRQENLRSNFFPDLKKIEDFDNLFKKSETI